MTVGKVEYWNEDLETCPVDALVERYDRLLSESKVFQRARRSALYKGRWKRAGIRVEELKSLEDLRKLPYIDSSALRESFERFDISEIVCSEEIVEWHCTSGSRGAPKWIPYTARDIRNVAEIVLRTGVATKSVRPGYIILDLGAPDPFASGAFLRWSVELASHHGISVEVIPATLAFAEMGLRFAYKRQPHVITGIPGVAARIAEIMEEGLDERVLKQLRDSMGVLSVAVSIVSRVKKIKPKDIFRRLRIGGFTGDRLEPYRRMIESAYGVEAFDEYGMTEFGVLASECYKHCGLHLWSDFVIPEIIPLSELERGGSTPEALLIDQWYEGLVGELVVTSFSEALPLIRYRTGDLVIVRGMSTCKCGRTHPRISVLRRLDDVVNLGGIRLSVDQIEKALSEVRSGKVRKWEIHLSRTGYKARARLLVEVAGASSAEGLEREILERLYELCPRVKTWIEAGMACPIEIDLVDDLVEKRTPTGKVKRVFYDDSPY